jgi:hypothetical protein
MKAKILFAAVTLAIMFFTAPSAFGQQAANNNDDPFSYSVSEVSSEIRSLSTVIRNNKVYINWTAADRSGESFYIIERSADGKSFQKLAVKKGAPSPGSDALLFSFTDDQPMKGNLVYRVQQVAQDGSTQTATSQVMNGNLDTNRQDDLAWKK